MWDFSTIPPLVVSVSDAQRALEERERERLMQASIHEAYAARVSSLNERLSVARDKLRATQIENRKFDSPGREPCALCAPLSSLLLVELLCMFSFYFRRPSAPASYVN